jgi:mRNA interferase RelE/StbE
VHKILFTKQAYKALRKMPRSTAQRIREKIELLATDPYAPNLNVRKLTARSGYRLRVGDWRIIYEIRREELIILVLKVAPRGEVYK